MENQKMTQFGQKFKFTLSVGMLVTLLLLVFYIEDFQLREFCKALAVVACLNVFRVMSNHNISINK